MGQDFYLLYKNLYTSEIPVDYSKISPFCETDEILDQSKTEIKPDQKHIYLTSKATLLSADAQKKIKEKRQQKLKQLRQQTTQDATQDNKQNVKENNQEKQQAQNARINYTQNMAIAFLLKKMPSTFGVAIRIFSEIKYRLPLQKYENILDYGAGLGSGVAAFNDLFPECKNLIACEPSSIMRKLGKHMTQDIKELIWIDSLSRLITLKNQSQFDIVYIGYVLGEVIGAQEKIQIIDTLWNLVKENGLIVFVENGTPRGARFTHDFRQHILLKGNSSIISPCPHNEKCPLADKSNAWCNFEQKIGKYPKQIFPKMKWEQQFIEEKFSYIVVKKGQKEHSIDYFIENQTDNLTPAQQSFFWSRILFPLISSKKHIIMDLCTVDGKFERRVVAKSYGDIYRDAKDVKWGDLWHHERRIPNRFRKEDKFSERLW